MNYVETIADLFYQRSGNAILSATDYVLISEWEKEEIPLEIVVGAIQKTFDNLRENTENIKSISFFQDEIQNLFAKSF